MATGTEIGALFVRIGADTKDLKKGVNSIATDVNKAVTSVARLGQAFAASLAVREIYKYTEAWTGLQNRLKLVTDSTQQLRSSTQDVFNVAQRTGQAISTVAEVYQRFAQNAAALGVNLYEVSNITETVTQAVALSGASAAASEAALTQFGQALAAGALRGEELNSVMEQTPALAAAIAEGLGVPIGALKGMAAEGEITSQRLIEALQKVAPSVAEDFAKIDQPISAAFTRVGNSLTRLVGEFDSAFGASGSVAGAVNNLSSWIDDIADSVDGVVSDFKFLRDEISSLMENIKSFFTGVFGEIESKTQEMADNAYDSIAEYVVESAQELQKLLNTFVGFAAAVQSVFTTMNDNLVILFKNAFNAISGLASDMVGKIVSGINAISSIAGIPAIEFGGFGGGQMESIQSITANMEAAYWAASKYFDFADKMQGRFDMHRGLTASENAFDYDLQSGSAVTTLDTITADGSKNKKGSKGGRDGEDKEAREYQRRLNQYQKFLDDRMGREETDYERRNQLLMEQFEAGMLQDEEFGLAKLEAMAAHEDMMTQLINDKYLARIEQLAALREGGKISDEEYKMMMLEAEAAYQDALTEEERRGIDERKKLQDAAAAHRERVEEGLTNSIIGLLQKLGQKSKAAAIAAIALQKMQALAQIKVTTATVGMLAFASQLIPGDPTSLARAAAAKAAVTAMGAVQAGIVVASGLMEAASVGSSSGGSSSGSSGYRSSGSYGSSNSAASEVAAEAPKTNTIVTINMTGETYSKKQVRELIEHINDAVSDGATLRLA
ncbi:tape measure protein [Advenella sp. WQ 585]|uniref:Tape measure protein n=1 Tax=Advenella mandrilli TaxID=2800330 RepID=A0ABS1E9Q5_9BURK|nr:tape measure protein [Advenella mandrilli]MBK1780557.1 tape measure protein [Advenella mandrilli]